MTKGHPLKGCLFYFPNFFSLIEFFYIWKYENHPRGNSLTVAWPGTARDPAIWQMGKNPRGNSLTVAKAAVPPRTPPYRPRKNLMFKIIILSKEIDVFFTGICGNMVEC